MSCPRRKWSKHVVFLAQLSWVRGSVPAFLEPRSHGYLSAHAVLSHVGRRAGVCAARTVHRPGLESPPQGLWCGF